jgi:hypothetical protein
MHDQSRCAPICIHDGNEPHARSVSRSARNTPGVLVCDQPSRGDRIREPLLVRRIQCSEPSRRRRQLQRGDAMLTAAEMLEACAFELEGNEVVFVLIKERASLRHNFFRTQVGEGSSTCEHHKARTILSQGDPCRFRLLYSERQGQGHLSLTGRQESDDRNPGSQRFLRRGKLDRHAAAHSDR